MGDATIAGLERWAEAYIERLAPAAQRRLLRVIAAELHRRNQRRMQAQKGPDGIPWAPRKAQRPRHKNGRFAGVIRRGAMMRKLRRNARFTLRIARTAKIGWFGRDGGIARIQHEGGRQRLQWGEANYPARELLALPAADLRAMRALLLDTLKEKR